MKPEAQKIAIAEACGWLDVMHGCGYPNKEATGVKRLPDYLNDLNAMHEAEKVLTEEQLYEMDNWLRVAEGITAAYQWRASAAQRAEAFLRALGKWEDET